MAKSRLIVLQNEEYTSQWNPHTLSTNLQKTKKQTIKATKKQVQTYKHSNTNNKNKHTNINIQKQVQTQNTTARKWNRNKRISY